MAKDIASTLGVAAPYVSDGSTVESNFLDAIHLALTGTRSSGKDTYRKTEEILDRLDLTYDPFWDTSESAGKGGGTVTNRAYSRMRVAITGVPRCFIFNTTDATSGARWRDPREDVYHYASGVRGQTSLNDAGPGSLVLFYSTGTSTKYPKHFVSTASVSYIAPGWTGPWQAKLEQQRDLSRAVPAAEVELAGWNRQNAITEIDHQTYLAISALGEDSALTLNSSVSNRTTGPDRTGEFAAAKVLTNFPPHLDRAQIEVPSTLPKGLLKPSESLAHAYDNGDPPRASGGPSRKQVGRRDRVLNKLAETRAIELASADLEKQGWELIFDRQSDGVGYDLEFVRDGRLLKVEVKGIQGSETVFNLTPKEFWRAQTDEDWVLIAVTSVLSPTSYVIKLIARDEIVEAPRQVSGYRVSL